MAKLAAAYEYSDAELLKLYREALAKCATTGGSYTLGDRSFTSHDLPEIRAQISWLETRIGQASTGISINKLQLKRPSS